MRAVKRDGVRFAPIANSFNAIGDRGADSRAAAADNLEAAEVDRRVGRRASSDIFSAAVIDHRARGRAAMVGNFNAAVIDIRSGGRAARDILPAAEINRRPEGIAAVDTFDTAVH